MNAHTQLCNPISASAVHKIECNDGNGHIEYSRQNGCAVIGSFIVDTLQHNATSNLLAQAINTLKALNINSCKLAVHDDISSSEHNYNAFKNIMEDHGFQKDEDNLFSNDNLQESCIGSEYTESTIVFNLPYEFINELADESIEREPELHIYLTNSASSQVTRFKLPDTPTTRYTSRGVLSFSMRLKSQFIDSDTNVNFSLYSKIMNKHREFCKKRAGCANVPLESLITHRNKKQTIRLTFIVPVLPDIEKSKLILKIDPTSVVLNNATVRPHNINHNLNQQYADRLIHNYKEQTWNTFNRKFKPSWRCIRNIHAYEYVNECGNYPAQTFQMVEPPETVPDYWVNAIRVCLKRDNHRYTIDQFANMPDTPENNNYAARIMAECCTLYSNYCKYITDKVETGNRNDVRFGHAPQTLEKSMDSFEGVRPTNAADCEDFGVEMLVESCEIEDLALHMHTSLHTLKHATSDHKAVQKIINARNNYYAFATLSGVSSATVNGDYGKLEKMGAHEYVTLIPKAYFYDCMRRCYGAEGHPLIYPEDAQRGRDLDVLVCEGTGLLRPDGKGSESPVQQRARDLVEDYGVSNTEVIDAFDGLRRMYYFDKNVGSEFYKINISMFTNEFFLRGYRCGEFTWIYGNNKNGTYGVDFIDVTSKSTKPALFVQPEMSPPLYNYIKEKLRDLHPIIPLQPPKKTSALYLDPYAAQLVIPREKDMRYTNVEYFARKGQLSKRRVEVLRTNAVKKGIAVDVIREPITETLTGYRLIFKVPIYK